MAVEGEGGGGVGARREDEAGPRVPTWGALKVRPAGGTHSGGLNGRCCKLGKSGSWRRAARADNAEGRLAGLIGGTPVNIISLQTQCKGLDNSDANIGGPGKSNEGLNRYREMSERRPKPYQRRGGGKDIRLRSKPGLQKGGSVMREEITHCVGPEQNE